MSEDPSAPTVVSEEVPATGIDHPDTSPTATIGQVEGSNEVEASNDGKDSGTVLALLTSRHMT